VEALKIEISSLEHEYSLILSGLKDVEAQGRAMIKQNEVLIREQKALREKVEELNRCKEETNRQCQEQVNELDQQIRDLCFYSKMKRQVAASPLKEELEGGSVVVPVGTPVGVSNSGGKRKIPPPSHRKTK
jgi:regulator of replication initiation timing